MSLHGKRALLAIAIAVPLLIVGVAVLQGQQDTVVPDYTIDDTEDAGTVLAVPDEAEPAVVPVKTAEDENPLKPLGPRASDRLPSACGSCGG